MLDVAAVSKTFPSRTGPVRAVDDVSLRIARGQCYGLIGESGSGKSTLASMVAGITTPDDGCIALDGHQWQPRKAAGTRQHQMRLQMVFQDPRASFDPRMTIGEALREPLRYKIHAPSRDHAARITKALAEVGLPASFTGRDIASVSVGQAQRVAIARALLARPALLICDEVTSALDVTVQAEILDLLQQIRTTHCLTMLFISHDIAVVARLADHLGVMKHGRIVEEGTTASVIRTPTTDYTRLLLESA